MRLNFIQKREYKTLERWTANYKLWGFLIRTEYWGKDKPFVLSYRLSYGNVYSNSESFRTLDEAWARAEEVADTDIYKLLHVTNPQLPGFKISGFDYIPGFGSVALTNVILEQRKMKIGLWTIKIFYYDANWVQYNKRKGNITKGRTGQPLFSIKVWVPGTKLLYETEAYTYDSAIATATQYASRDPYELLGLDSEAYLKKGIDTWEDE